MTQVEAEIRKAIQSASVRSRIAAALAAELRANGVVHATELRRGSDGSWTIVHE